MSATTLLKGYTNTNNTDDIKERNPLYNPSIPDMNDPKREIKSIRDMKFRDMYSTQMRLDAQMKNTNGDGFCLDGNTKYLKRRDYDRIIDPNYLRVINPKNKKYTIPDDYYTGHSVLGYFDIPKIIPRPQPTIDMSGVINPMNSYQYKQRFIQDSNISTPSIKPSTVDTSKVTIPQAPQKSKPLNDLKTIGTDPTQDPAYVKEQQYKDYIEKMKKPSGSTADRISRLRSNAASNAVSNAPTDNNIPSSDFEQKMKEIERQRQQSIMNANTQQTTSYDKDSRDKYGNPLIINQHKTVPIKSGIKSVGLF